MVSRYYAVKELLESGMNSLPVTTEQLEDIITSKGFKIIYYDVSCKEHADILERLGVLQLADRTKAFTYISGHEKIVFIKIGISANEKRLLLAHELGHITMGHMSDNGVIGYQPGGLIDEAQEDEANAFALEFLAPVCILSKKHINTCQKISGLTLLDEKRSRLIADEVHNHKKLTNIEAVLFNQFEIQNKSYSYKTITYGIIILLMSISMFLMFICLSPEKSLSEPMSTTAPLAATHSYPETIISSDSVYITKTGKKFHKQNCRHIKNSSTITDISINNAIDAGYEPCKDCFSELD